MSSDDIDAIWLTLKLAALATTLLLLIGTPLAWWLARGRSRWRPLIEALVALPLVLPPTVLGFYLLLAFAPDSGLAVLWKSLTGGALAFSFEGLVLASLVYSMPFVVQPLQAGFYRLPAATLEAASLSTGPIDRFFSVILPLCRRPLLAGASLGFAHTVGEFGVVLMIGGNIPGETRVLSMALYDHVETLNMAAAHTLAAGLMLFSLAVLTLIYSLDPHARLRLRPVTP